MPELAPVTMATGFQQRYLQIVGVKLAQLDALEARIAEVLALLQPNDATAAEKAAHARTQAEQSAQASGDFVGRSEPPKESFRPAESLKSLYRTLAKAVHPDLATDPKDREHRTAWMADVNAAYQANDAVRLQELWERWQHSPDSVSGAGIGADLVRLIRQIAQVSARIGDVDAELGRLQAGELFHLLHKVEAAAADGLDLLETLAADLDGQIEQKRNQLNALLDEFASRKSAL
jgi:hypothetical protein